MNQETIPLHPTLGKDAEAAIQAELQTYLDDKGLTTLFQKLVQDILLNKPDNPVEYMVKYLFEKYPQETKKLQTQDTGIIDFEEEPDEDFSEEEDDDLFDELKEEEFFAKRSQDKNAPPRRISVSAEVLKVGETDWNSFKKYEKTDEEQQKLNDILQKNMLCSHLSDEDLAKIISACEKENVAAETEIITQGAIDAQYYYIIGDGTAEVWKDGKKVHEYEKGDAFGELALMYNAPRAATVKTTSDCELWKLDQKVFKRILMGSAMRTRAKRFEFLSKVEILKDMAEIERKRLSDALQEKHYKLGDVICSQGEPGDDFFIISEGSVSVAVNDQNVGDLNPSQYFGEIALLTSKPRQATITANSETVTLLSVNRKVFQRVIGPLSEILKRNMKTYSQYVAGVRVA